MISRANVNDVPIILRIERKCFGRRGFSKAHIIWILKNPAAMTYVYSHQERPVGTIMLKRDLDVARVVSIAVLPGQRRRGVGTELMAMAEDIMREQGAKVMKLEVNVNNDTAINFYRHLGYDFDGILKGYYSWGEDAYVMGKTLDQEEDSEVDCIGFRS
ncbi:MAG: GNAT family N-acetyltransferase [Thermoplasmata archaeon]